MEIKKRTPDLENIFNKQWKANNYQQNGMSKILDQRKEHYNKMFNIDYLWILYTYGYRAPKTFNSNDTGFSPFPTDILKDYYI